MNKKILSVVLAVLVFVCGFSTTLTALKPAQAEITWNLDYTTLPTAENGYVVEQAKGKGVTASGIHLISAAEGINSANAIAIEANANAVGLRIIDSFFTSIFADGKIGNYESTDDFKAYVTYAVNSGSQFAIQYLEYTEHNYNTQKVSTRYENLEILVSSDGVNFVPAANVDYKFIEEANGSFDRYTAVLSGVGENTRYVRVVFPQKMSDTSSWAPHNVFVLEKVSADLGTGLATGETKLDFAANTSWTSAFMAAVSGVSSAIDVSDFYGSNRFLSGYGYNARDWAELDAKAWGTITEAERSVMLKVQPGTRFSLNAYENSPMMVELRKHFAATTANPVEIKVLTSSGDGEWTEHRAAPQNVTRQNLSGPPYVQTHGTTYDIDFIVPEDHCYARIVFPLEGSAELISKVNYDTDPDGSRATLMRSLIYTPYDAATAYEYGTNIKYSGTAYTYPVSIYTIKGQPLLLHSATTAEALGAVEIYNTDNDWLSLGYTTSTGIGRSSEQKYNYVLGNASTELTKETLPYLVYEVQGGTLFTADLFFNKSNTNAYFNYTRHDNTSVNGDLGIIIYTADSLDGKWTEITSFDQHHLDFKLAASSVVNYSVLASVPTDAKYVKVAIGIYGICTGANAAYFSDQFGLTGVHFTKPQEAMDTVTYDYTDSSILASDTHITDRHYDTLGLYDVQGEAGLVYNQNGANYNLTADYYTVLGKNWGELKPTELIYEVYPGSTFSADLYMHYSAGTTLKGKADFNYWLKTQVDANEKFEFFISAAATAKGDYKNVVDSSSFGNGDFTMNYTVPADCRFVKLTLPSKGSVVGNGSSAGIGTSVDFARIKGVSYVPYEKGDLESFNNYAGKDSDEINKVDCRIYKYYGVELTENGLTADENDAYVVYKTGNKRDLVVTSPDKLTFKVSYDGINYVNANIRAVGNEYTVDTSASKNFVKVCLNEGETIVGVKAELLNPTLTFVNYLGNTKVVENVGYGEAIPNPAFGNRYGYILTGWSESLSEGVSEDTTFVASYAKDTNNLFTVKLDNESVVFGADINFPKNVTGTTVRYEDRITVEAPATYSDSTNTLVFDYWKDQDGNKIANSRIFSFLANQSVTLTAVYNFEKSTADPFVYNSKVASVYDNGNGTHNMTVVWRTAVPSDITVTETGIILGTTPDEETLKANGAGTVKLVHKNTNATNKTLSYTINNIKDGAKRFALPYAVLSNGNTIYGYVASNEELSTNDALVAKAISGIYTSDDYMITLVGDSITEGATGNYILSQRYPGQLAIKLGEIFPDRQINRIDGVTNGMGNPLASYNTPVAVQNGNGGEITVVNAGIGGDTAARLVNRMNADFIWSEDATGAVASLGKAADLIIINIGVNDCGAAVTIPDYTTRIQTVIDEIKAKNPTTQILLMTPTTEDNHTAEVATDKAIYAYATAMKELAVENGIGYIDLNAVWNEKYTPGQTDKSGMTVYHCDALHPSVLGNTLMAETIIDALF